jgi:hypothetical protein
VAHRDQVRGSLAISTPRFSISIVAKRCSRWQWWRKPNPSYGLVRSNTSSAFATSGLGDGTATGRAG